MKVNEARDRLNLSVYENVDPKILADIFKMAGDYFRNDINAIWFRGQFFLLFNLGMLTFFSSTGFDRNSKTLVLIVSLAGCVTSVAWCIILKITISWINVWRMALVDVEAQLVVFGPFARGENLSGSKLHECLRPENFAMALSVVFIVIWLVIFVLGVFGYFGQGGVGHSGTKDANPIIREIPRQKGFRCQPNLQKCRGGVTVLPVKWVI